MIDHVLGRPSVKSRRLQVLAVLAVWATYLARGNKHGPPLLRALSRLSTSRLTTWQTILITMLYLYAARNLSTLIGFASPEPLANMYDPKYFRATWVLTALDAGFWTAMKIKTKWVRDAASIAFTGYYLIAAEKADEKVRKIRGNLTVEHLRVSWNKGTSTPLKFFQSFLRPRVTRWPPREVRIRRPHTSDYTEPISAWLYYDGPLQELRETNIDRVVLDLPGGGFVAMDPRCNDDKLLAWSAQTGLPILSLDYRKAPEYPYPYALNEAYDAYVMLIRSRGTCIGMSGAEVPKVVVTGDSAGGNLATAMTLMVTERVGSGPGEASIPVPAALILFYPGLDMNIGNWMSDQQMALIKDRKLRKTNAPVLKRKSMTYSKLAGTPHESDDEDTPTPEVSAIGKGKEKMVLDDVDANGVPDTLTNGAPVLLGPEEITSPKPAYAHRGPQALNANVESKPQPTSTTTTTSPPRGPTPTPSYHPRPLSTRLAMSSMISYFNDRILTPEMMRAMIILYIGPHLRPDFSTDYHLSPILAPDLLLARFPKVYFLTGERDPLVDDTVIFAGRLVRVKAALAASGGRRVVYRPEDAGTDQGRRPFWDEDAAKVTLIPGVSHGFLQFPTIYPPAWKRIEQSGQWIEEAFHEAEMREREERRAGAERGRHHVRSESSESEDIGLEMAMTRVRSLKKSPPPRETKVVEEAGAGGAHDVEVPKCDGKPAGPPARAKRKVRVRTDDVDLSKLASEEDLMSRRMLDLAGGLTRLEEED